MSDKCALCGRGDAAPHGRSAAVHGVTRGTVAVAQGRICADCTRDAVAAWVRAAIARNVAAAPADAGVEPPQLA